MIGEVDGILAFPLVCDVLCRSVCYLHHNIPQGISQWSASVPVVPKDSITFP